MGGSTLPDIVGEQSVKSKWWSFFEEKDLWIDLGSFQHSTKSANTNNKKSNDNGLCVLGYENVKSAPVHPKVRQELDYLDREVCSRKMFFFFNRHSSSLFTGTPSCYCLSIGSPKKTRYSFERSRKLYGHFTCENPWTMSNYTSSRSLFIDIISSILTDLSCFH